MVMTEVHLARVEGCRMLQFTRSGIFRLKILSTTPATGAGAKYKPCRQTKLDGNGQTGSDCLTD